MKRVINNIKYTAAAICAVACMSSCEDFLSTVPLNDIVLENFWENESEVSSVVTSCYSGIANEEFLKQVWINLTDNAIKFAPAGGTVMIEITDNKDHFSVSVGNTGSEIPKEERERIFNKFYQADRSHATEGNGVGLAIVKRIVDLHGGEIEVDSADGVTTFTVVLPKKK
jgi:signal transduction histidine kinase